MGAGAGRPGLIRSYLLRETLKPLCLALLVTLTALLLERVLRLFELLASVGGSFDLVVQLALNLVPHYLGLALPAAFFIALFMVVSEVDAANELDVMRASGLSAWQIARPLIAMGVLFALISLLLFGFVQPYSRYAYRAILHAATSAVWDATMIEGVIADAGDGRAIAADAVDGTGRSLRGVFLREPTGGGERVVTAAEGKLSNAAGGSRVDLVALDGEVVRFDAAGRGDTVGFDAMQLSRERGAAAPFRLRGEDDRELTLVELWRMSRLAHPPIPANRLLSELHGRLTRAAALPVLPLLAMALGTAAKRRRRAAGMVLGAALLVVFHHAIQLGESLANADRVDAALAIWSPYALFAALCLWAFLRASAHPDRNPAYAAFDLAERVVSGGAALFRRRSPA